MRTKKNLYGKPKTYPYYVRIMAGPHSYLMGTTKGPYYSGVFKTKKEAEDFSKNQAWKVFGSQVKIKTKVIDRRKR